MCAAKTIHPTARNFIYPRNTKILLPASSVLPLIVQRLWKNDQSFLLSPSLGGFLRSKVYHCSEEEHVKHYLPFQSSLVYTNASHFKP
mmetsp:Transcript_13547/g.22781  ORF Transcript_13547/g.22781 Transcript_13547/m.22781 type:complete len:88 (-) Transcript_13547:118-381(-)